MKTTFCFAGLVFSCLLNLPHSAALADDAAQPVSIGPDFAIGAAAKAERATGGVTELSTPK